MGGPVAGQTLGFLGAEVLKIESRARIDMTRNLPPFAEGMCRGPTAACPTTPAGPATARYR
jgi:crotonobetainyl-CoA:carnitine CoA-transferase CaiB-like acyl-CoA transferase